MFRVHGYSGDKRIIDWRIAHVPRVGDTVRLSGDRYFTVTEVVWCLDEDDSGGMRANIRLSDLAPIPSGEKDQPHD